MSSAVSNQGVLLTNISGKNLDGGSKHRAILSSSKSVDFPNRFGLVSYPGQSEWRMKIVFHKE